MPNDPSPIRRADVARQSANVLLAIAQLVAPPLIFANRFDPASPDGRMPLGATPIEPAASAFTIWSVIFAGSFAYAMLQARPSARTDALHRAIGWRTAGGIAGAVLWLVVARTGPLWATVLLIIATWLAVTGALVTTARVSLSVARRALALAGALGVRVLRAVRYSFAYMAAVVRALVGIVMTSLTRARGDAVAALAATEAALLLALWAFGRRRRVVSVLCAAATFLAAPASGAQSGTVAGRVVSAATQEPLGTARIRVPGTSAESESDSTGRFVLRGVPVGVRRLEVRRIGYTPVVRTDVVVSAGRAAELTVELQPAAARLTGVTVTPRYFSTVPAVSTPVSTQTLTAEEIRRAPGVQEDVVRAIAILPGVSVTDPVANSVVVRGGGSAENLYVVDDVEVPSINHFSTPGSTSGVLSVFPVSLVSEASLSAGGFGARFGDRTASVTTVSLREGSQERRATQLTLSATGVGLVAEGPLGSGASYIVGARRSYLDLLFRALELPFVPTYTDLTLKVVARPSSRDRVSAFVAGAVDRLSLDPKTADDRYDVSRLATPQQDGYFSGLTWQRVLSRGLVSVTLGRSWARFRVAQSDSGTAARAPAVVFRTDAEEGETSLRADLSYRAAEWLTIDAGNIVKRAGRLRYRVVLPGEFRTDAGGIPSPLRVDTAFTAARNATYLQATAQPRTWLRVTGGARVDAYAFLDDAVRVGPRGALIVTLDEASTISLSGGRYWQAPPLAWLVGAPDNPRTLRPFRADQAVLGWQRTLRPAVKVQVEGYVKQYGQYPVRLNRPRAVLQPTGTDATTDVPLGLEPLASSGTGRAWGVEAFVQKRLSEVPVYGLLAVSVNRTRFRALDGVESRGAFDLPLGVSGLAGWRPNERWELAARLRTGSGLPTTPYVTDGPAAGSLDFTRYNAGPRLDPFFALDVRVDRRWSLRTRGQLVAYLDVQDATARRNETFPLYDQRTGRVERQRFTGLLPSIGLTWERGG